MTKEQKMALAVATGTSFTTAFSGSALNLAIPAMGTYFHMGAANVGWITTTYMLVIAAMAVPFGKIADSTSRRNMLVAGVAVFGAFSVLGIFAWSSATILITRAIQGIGAAMIFASNMPIAIDAFPGNERGKAIGIVTSGIYTGLALGPALGGLLNHLFGWKAIFLFGAAIALTSMILTFTGVPKDKQKRAGKTFDLAGNIAYVLMIACLIYGLTAINSFRFGWVILVCGVLLGVLFTHIELKSENPVIDVRIFAEDRVFTLSNLTALFNYSATFALGYLVSIYLQVAQGLTSQMAGLIMIAQPLFMALLSPRMGRLSDRIPAYKLASGGMAVCALTLLFFAFARVNMPIWAIFIALAVAGVGIALFSSPNTNVIMGCVPHSKFAVTNSLLSTMRTTGQTTGMAIVTIVVSATVGNLSLYEVPVTDLIHTMHICFLIFTALCILGIFMSLQRRKS
ncbi:MAG: MFS transporter [Firmicutes bacterium]|nr:MFS transporter [Bacillota bacterium]